MMQDRSVESKNGHTPRRTRRRSPAAEGRAPGPIATRDEFRETFDLIVENIERVIRGKNDVIRSILVAVLADGHVLLEDLPGTGKTMLARAIAESIDAKQGRIQCTPDLLPSDITGSPIYDQRDATFVFREGPVFANILLVDEINRTTPKTQSALLEAMQERRVSVDNRTHTLPRPFVVLATQNPIELAGTFPLPEAQIDRFLLKLSMGYPNLEHEADILESHGSRNVINDVGAVVSLETVVGMMDWANDVSVDRSIHLYIAAICQATRNDPALTMGASTRASLALLRVARVMAASQGRDDVVPDDVVAFVKPVLSHRLVLAPDAALRGETVSAVIERLMAKVKVPAHVPGAVSRGRS